MVTELLRPEEFYMPAHRMIYDAICAIVAGQRRVDMVTLQDELSKRQRALHEAAFVNPKPVNDRLRDTVRRYRDATGV